MLSKNVTITMVVLCALSFVLSFKGYVTVFQCFLRFMFFSKYDVHKLLLLHFILHNISNNIWKNIRHYKDMEIKMVFHKEKGCFFYYIGHFFVLDFVEQDNHEKNAFTMQNKI